MPLRIKVGLAGEISTEDRPYTAEEAAAYQAGVESIAARDAKQQDRAAKLAALNANENSLPVVRDKVNQILELLGGAA